MDDYLVYFDDEEIPNNNVNNTDTIEVKIETPIEPKLEVTNVEKTNNTDVELEPYEEHMDYVNKLFTKLKNPENELQEKTIYIKKIENLKTKYPHVNYKQVSINDDLNTIKKVYNEYRFDVIKHLGSEINKEDTEVDNLTKAMGDVIMTIFSTIGQNDTISYGQTNTLSYPNYHIVVSDLASLINNTLHTTTDLLTSPEFLHEKTINNLSKNEDVNSITNEINNLKKIIDNKKGCTWMEEQKLEKLHDQINKILGKEVNDNYCDASDDSSSECGCSDDDTDESDGGCHGTKNN